MEVAGKVAVVTGGGLEPDAVAELTLNVVRENRFMVMPHPQVLDMYRLKGADYDGWIAGMRRYRRRLTADG
jgi:hypothetical protein